MKIYTRKGDDGETSLFGGLRVPKNDARVEAYGSVDELNSAIGLAIASLPDVLGDWRDRLAELQADCFTIGAILATPASGEKMPDHIPALREARVTELESWIDELDRELEPLTAFILPGGVESAATLHVARTTCRRAERRVVALAQREDVDAIIIKYLNRLSDFLFAVARVANARSGVKDTVWRRPSEP